MIIIFGGQKDFNIGRILSFLERNKIEHLPVILRPEYHPTVLWDIDSDALLIDGQAIQPLAIYIRQDVFESSPISNGLGRKIYSILRSYALAHPNVQMFNKGYIGMHKAFNLNLAKRLGLEIPKTAISNQVSFIEAIPKKENFIVKPLGGGAYTQTLNTFIEKKKFNGQEIVFLQEKLIQPEMRVYYIGGEIFSFHLISDQLDYRTDANVKIEEAVPDKNIVQGFKTLCIELKLSYAAADFKTSERDGKYKFLEVNSSPMFAAFDKVSKGKLCRSITRYLRKG